MKILIKNIDGLVLPSQSNPTDSGYDVFAASDPEIVGVYQDSKNPLNYKGWQRIDYIRYKTNLFIAPVTEMNMGGGMFGMMDYINHHVLMHPRSSISKMNLVLANSIGLVDMGYRGEIEFRFKYIMQPEDLYVNDRCILVQPNMERIYKKGDRIGQLLAEPKTKIEFELVNELPDSDRGTGGFGSTEKKG